MDAMDFFKGLAEARRAIERERALRQRREERRRDLGCKLHEHVRSSGKAGSYDRFDRYIDEDAEADVAEREAHRELDRGRAVFDGMRRLGGKVADGACVAEFVYADGSTFSEAADALCVSLSTARRDFAVARDWLDANGIAHAMEGTGTAG